MNFHVASRGGGGGVVTCNFGIPVGGHEKTFFLARFARSYIYIYNLNSLIVRQATKFFCFFYFYKCKSYSVLVFLL